MKTFTWTRTVIILLVFAIAAGCTSTTSSQSVQIASLPLTVQVALKNEFQDFGLKSIPLEKLEQQEAFTIKGLGEKQVDLSVVEKMKKLTSITLDDVNPDSYDFLYELPQLSSLTLRMMRVDHLPDFSRLKLRSVELEGFHLETLEILKDNQELEALVVRNNQLVSLNGIQNMSHLKHLMLSDNPITDLSMLRDLSELIRLEARGTRIEDLSSLASSNRLEILDIRNTDVETIAPVAHLPALKVVMATKKRVEDLSSLPGQVEVSDQTILDY